MVNSIVLERLRGDIGELRGEETFTYLAKAKELEARGVKVISFGIGQPDIPTFLNIRNAAKRAIDEGFTGYTEASGIRELREAIADYLNRRYGSDVSPEEVIVTTGAKTAIFLAMASYIRPGDEVIIPDPTYPAYPELVKYFGGKPIYVPMSFDPDNGFSLNVKAIEGAINERSKAIVLNNPHNPTGAVFRPSEVAKILELARDHRLLVLVDEIYDNFVYENEIFKSVLELDKDWRSNIIYINGFSKTFSMTGWRLGYLVAAREAVDIMKRLAVNIYSCPPSISQRAGVEAIRGEESWREVSKMIEMFKRRRDVMYEELRKVPGFEVWKSNGAFYMYPRVKDALNKLGMDVVKFAEWLLEEHGVVVIPGTAFSETHMGKEFVRFSFAIDEEYIREGVGRIRDALSKAFNTSQ